MISTTDLGERLAEVGLDAGIGELRPDYRALIILADRLTAGPSDEASETVLAAAERRAVARLAQTPLAEDPHVADWRAAFKAFGVKPQRFRPGFESLLRRVEQGLPRVDRLTDVYNAVSIDFAVPIGGEDLDRYQGPMRLVRATGDEDFDTVDEGAPAVQHPLAGEVVWRDDAGVTCRCWNWRQCVRTRLTGDTRRAVFVLDALGSLPDERLLAAGAALKEGLAAVSPQAQFRDRLIRAV
jgi:DNA/RNA-binding domain of Phe-tRNA-synthetase-like protein